MRIICTRIGSSTSMPTNLTGTVPGTAGNVLEGVVKAKWAGKVECNKYFITVLK